MGLMRGPGRGRAFFRFVFALVWLAVSYLLAEKAAHGFSHGATFPLIRNLFEIFLLVLGYSYMEMTWDGARHPLRDMGLPLRQGGASEFALGAALGWGMVVVVFLILVLGATFYVALSSSAQAWGHLLLQILTLAAAALAAEIAFRGYPFQKLIQVTGPFTATLLAAIFFGLARFKTPGATPAAMWISAVAALLLSVAYLRTRALWLGWGVHFAWLASIGILFGQPLAGDRSASSVVRSYVDGPRWLTGGEFGPEASLITLLVLWVGLVVLVRITHNLAWKNRLPEWNPSVADDPPLAAAPDIPPSSPDAYPVSPHPSAVPDGPADPEVR